jgi:uncharacterized protein YcbK (DUF882 family)
MQLSKSFKQSEFACPCCGNKFISFLLVNKLQELRDKLDEPIYILSGVRCEAYNKEIGGYNDSPHIKGLAADIQVGDLPPFVLAYNAEDIPDVRLGIYPHHLHLDIVAPNPSRFWLVKKGKYIYSGQEKSLKRFLDKNL